MHSPQIDTGGPPQQPKQADGVANGQSGGAAVGCLHSIGSGRVHGDWMFCNHPAPFHLHRPWPSCVCSWRQGALPLGAAGSRCECETLKS